ncbi:MAG: DegV family protein [Clostridia bacterium]|nr:DegV family protein [Clostridia bacterium]
MNYRIVSDSASNLHTLHENYRCVPLTIHCEGREFTDDPRLDLGEMLQTLKATAQKSSTSCPNVQDWLDAFQGADHVFAVTITGNLSGSYAAAMQAAALCDARVHVFNTLSAGPEMELIIEKIDELQAAGKNFDETVKEVNAYMRKTHLIFCLQSLNNLARNGRVSPAKAKIAGILGIRVVGVASAEGTLQPLHNSRGSVKSLEAILSVMKERGFKGGKIRIAHCRNSEAAETLRQKILALAKDCDIRIRSTTALCSFYAEEGGLMVGFEG